MTDERQSTFWAEVNGRQRPIGGQRHGQAVFNTAMDYWPELTEQTRGAYGLDPFHNDDVVPAFLAYLRAGGADV